MDYPGPPLLRTSALRRMDNGLGVLSCTQMVRDLSEVHEPIGVLGQSAAVALTPEQVAFFHEHGYLAGIRILDDAQIETLREDLARLTDPGHPGHDLFYEFHTNESSVSGSVLFHALGAWR